MIFEVIISGPGAMLPAVLGYREIKRKGKMMKCDVCGIEMTEPVSEDNGVTVEGMEINLKGEHKEVDRVRKIFGKTEFRICFVCWLLSLGVKKR